MDQDQPPRRIHSPHRSAALANPDWRPWMYQSFVGSNGIQLNQDIPGLSQYHEPAPPYPSDGIFLHNSINDGFHQNAPARFSDTNPFHNEHAFHEQPRHLIQQEQYMDMPHSAAARRLTTYPYPTRITSPYPSSSASTPSSDDTSLSQALNFLLRTSPAPFHNARLPRPIAVPQTTHGRGQSFLRAWAPCLEAHNISQTDFLAFIDNLNIVSTANPPLQVLDLAGGFLGMVPHHWAQLAGTAVQASAKLGTALVSKSRTDMYMKEVDEKMFKPRGLKVSIALVEAMRRILRVPDTQPLLAPLTRETMQMSTVERELLAVREYNAVLELGVPRPMEQTTILAKLSARQVEGLAKKNQKKAVKDREKALEKKEKARRREEEKRAKKEKKDEKRDSKRNKKHGKKGGQSDSDTDDDGSDRRPAEGIRKQEKTEKQGREEKSVGKVLWIVIENL